jgi:hypothetical protein
MNEIVKVVVAAVAIGSWFVFRARSRSAPKGHPADAGRDLRLMMLTTPPKEIGVSRSEEFPRVYAVLIDWPISNGVTASIFSSCEGTASLYTTSTFGIIGGEGHETVRAAAKALVKAADEHLATATPTTEFPYPGEGRVRFYLLTFDGVRVIDTDQATLNDPASKYSELFALGQAVLTELRLVTEQRP